MRNVNREAVSEAAHSGIEGGLYQNCRKWLNLRKILRDSDHIKGYGMSKVLRVKRSKSSATVKKLLPYFSGVKMKPQNMAAELDGKAPVGWGSAVRTTSAPAVLPGE